MRACRLAAVARSKHTLPYSRGEEGRLLFVAQENERGRSARPQAQPARQRSKQDSKLTRKARTRESSGVAATGCVKTPRPSSRQKRRRDKQKLNRDSPRNPPHPHTNHARFQAPISLKGEEKHNIFHHHHHPPLCRTRYIALIPPPQTGRTHSLATRRSLLLSTRLVKQSINKSNSP